MMLKRLMMAGSFGIVLLLLSAAISICLVFLLWLWLMPADFWQKLVTLLLSIVVGGAAFIGSFIFFSMLLLPIFVKKTMKRMLGQFQPPRFPGEPEPENDDDSDGPVDIMFK